MVEQLDLPLARRTDPDTAHLAAHAVAPGISALEAAIVHAMSAQYWVPMTAFRIAELVYVRHHKRWDEGSVRTAVSRMGKRGKLVKDGKGKSPRGHAADLWRLP